MTTYMVGYDLNSPGQDYPKLVDAIKSYSGWWHCLDSTWIIKSSSTAVQIRDHLMQYIDKNDELLVASLSGERAWTGFDQECSSWLKNDF